MILTRKYQKKKLFGTHMVQLCGVCRQSEHVVILHISLFFLVYIYIPQLKKIKRYLFSPHKRGTRAVVWVREHPDPLYSLEDMQLVS